MPTCSACTHHHAIDRPGYGECRALPPTNPTHTGIGLVMGYNRTADTLPACGQFQPKAAPVLETKPAAKVETKPAPAVDAKPAPTVETRPAPPIDRVSRKSDRDRRDGDR